MSNTEDSELSSSTECDDPYSSDNGSSHASLSALPLNNVIIEEISEAGLPPGERSQFVPADLQAAPGEPATSEQLPDEQTEGLLIKQLIAGELTFNDYNRQIGQIIASDDIDDPDDVDADANVPRPSKKMPIAPCSTVQSSDHFERELVQSRRDAIRGNLQGKSRTTRRRCVLPTALQGLMGSANLCYARGDTALAEKVCLEIIRQVPLAPEPFVTLAQIHEHNPDKYMQFSLIAAHLDPNDADQWIRIAQVSVEQGNVAQAINCYAKATKYNVHNNELRLARIRLLQQIGEDKLAFRVYCSMLNHIPATQPEFLVDTAKLVANQWLTDKQPGRALDAMRLAYDRLAGQMETADLNFFMELLGEMDQFERVLEVLQHNTAVQVLTAVDANTGADALHIPPDIILDFRTKLHVALVRLRAFHLLDAQFADIFAHMNVDDAGDCYLDIAEALIAERRYAEALRLLVPLVRSDNYSLAAVWLRHAECHRAIGNTREAIDSYRQVVRQAPQHFDARLTLSALLKQIGQHAEAMQALEQDMDSELIDPMVLYERGYMLHESGNWSQFLDTGLLLLSRHGVQLRNLGEMVLAAKIVKLSTKLQLIQENRAERMEPVEDVDGPEFVGGSSATGTAATAAQVAPAAQAAGSSSSVLTLQAEWKLFQDMMRVACEHGQWPMLMKITMAMMTCKAFAAYKAEIWFMATMAAVYNRNAQFAVILAKEQVERNIGVPRAWNLFCVITQFADTTWYGRYMFRMFKRQGIYGGAPLLMRGNYFLLSGSLKYAINDYVQVYRGCDAPLVALLLSVTFAHMSQQKHIQKKHSLMVQALAFANRYRVRREREAWHEVEYNMGRLHQAFGAMHLAAKHYRNVLEWQGEWASGEVAERLVGLRQEAAYNLHLIYVHSGNRDMARKVLNDYLVV